MSNYSQHVAAELLSAIDTVKGDRGYKRFTRETLRHAELSLALTFGKVRRELNPRPFTMIDLLMGGENRAAIIQ